ncbi:MAG: penicillin-binding protein 2 [Alphaproteobacteria bacterium]|nr:penicillin-binding protein 2 [Alphaproteobacteria bacterium]
MIFSYRLRRNAVKIEGERSSALDLARGRLVLMGGFFILMYIVFAVRAFDLAVIQGRAISADNGATVELSAMEGSEDAPGTLPADIARRGDITDRNGALLATTLRTASLFADPHLISDTARAAGGLAKIFPDISYGEILQKLQSDKRFVWISRNLSPEQQYSVLELGEPGLEFKHAYQRFYPQGALGSHLVGYADVDGRGLAGIERGFNNYLNSGETLRLSLDMRLQHALRREMTAVIDEFSAIGGAGLIMDVTNGDILAGVSLPDFNPHRAGEALETEVFNRLTLGAYEMGSVFKIFSIAAFFETHDVGMNTTFDTRDPIRIGRFTIRDYHAENRILTIPEVFMYSSNIGSALMGRAVGTENLQNFYEDLALTTPLDFEVREVARPMVPSPWREVNTLTASYGHGVATTPVQTISAVASVVNGGYLIKPRLVLAEDEGKASTDVRVVSEKTSNKMRELLRLVVTAGTGKNADVAGYRVGGKTGTAEKIINGRYDGNKKISSFVGVFPMDAPRYAVFIMIDEPKGTKRTYGYATGGWVAAPAVSRVIASMVAILGIPPSSPDSPENAYGQDLKQYVSAGKGEH